MHVVTLDPWTVASRGGLAVAWRGLSLIQKFTLIGLFVIGSGTSIIGAWVAQRIESAVVHNSASSAALYMSGLVEPIVTQVGPGGALTDQQIKQLDDLSASSAFGKAIVSIKIWADGSKVVYSNHKYVVDHRFPLTEGLQVAWSGGVAGEYNQLNERENQAESQLGIPLLEVYVPLRSADGSKVVAVGEFYSRADHLGTDLFEARMGSWMIVGLTGLGMFAALYGLVRQAGKTIVEQQVALKDRVAELSQALTRNTVLSAQVDDANGRSVVMNDRFLRRIGADLHDGPAQLLALALLRLDVVTSRSQAARATDVETLRKVLNDALKDIRNISGGLSLPEMQDMPLTKALELCARSHERRTGTNVACQLGQAGQEVSAAVKICLYRFVQEGLNNAFHHAAGTGQTVVLTVIDDAIEVTVSDRGKGFDPAVRSTTDRLGLAGLRDRIVSLGGAFEVHSSPGQGCRLVARFKLAAKGTLNV